jgi:hypothetical protein
MPQLSESCLCVVPFRPIEQPLNELRGSAALKPLLVEKTMFEESSHTRAQNEILLFLFGEHKASFHFHNFHLVALETQTHVIATVESEIFGSPIRTHFCFVESRRVLYRNVSKIQLLHEAE